MKLIIAGTDGSETAERAVAAAADLTKAVNGTLLVVNAGEHRFSNAEQLILERFRVTEGDTLEEMSLRTLKAARALAQARGVVSAETMSAGGDPVETLISIAHAKHADALVVGRRGRGRLSGLLLGSVSQKLAMLAPCMVIIVP